MTAADLPAGPELDRKVAEAIWRGGKIAHQEHPAHGVQYSTELCEETLHMTRFLTDYGGEFTLLFIGQHCYANWKGVNRGSKIPTEETSGDTLPLALARLVVRVAAWRAGR